MLDATVTMSHSTFKDSGSGVIALANSTIVLEDDQITQNTIGVYFNGGIIQTTGSDNIKFNVTNVTGGTLTSVSHD